MSVLQRVIDHMRVRRLWSRVDSLAEWGEYTAQWLDGDIGWHPGYPGDGPDPETDEIADVLAALCRAGVVTYQSQPGGRDECEPGGWSWVQRAAVEAVCSREDYDSLVDAVSSARLVVAAGEWVPVTEVDGKPYTGFGQRLGRRNLALTFYGASDRVMQEIENSVQVTVIEPDWDRNDRLWPVLAEWAATQETVRTG